MAAGLYRQGIRDAIRLSFARSIASLSTAGCYVISLACCAALEPITRSSAKACRSRLSHLAQSSEANHLSLTH
jgi:hypothetical protein